jgi:predicted metal-dependent HD superfamily phosphohydrolase
MSGSRVSMTERWTALWQRLGAPVDRVPSFDTIRLAYQTPVRAYHNLAHIEQCLDELDGLRGLCDEPDLVEAAIWFHDAIYDAKRGDNEPRSAELAGQVMRGAGLSADAIGKVGELIAATKHSSAPSTQDARVLTDIDLAILGQHVVSFDRYEQGIREEYAFVPEPDFRVGRAKILKGFLERQSIYLTDEMIKLYEAAARENLRRSIERLTHS